MTARDDIIHELNQAMGWLVARVDVLISNDEMPAECGRKLKGALDLARKSMDLVPPEIRRRPYVSEGGIEVDGETIVLRTVVRPAGYPEVRTDRDRNRRRPRRRRPLSKVDQMIRDAKHRAEARWNFCRDTYQRALDDFRSSLVAGRLSFGRGVPTTLAIEHALIRVIREHDEKTMAEPDPEEGAP